MEAKTLDYGAIGWMLNHLRHGHKMRRSTWIAGSWLRYDPVDKVVLHHFGVDNSEQDWQCTQPELLASDWQLVTE